MTQIPLKTQLHIAGKENEPGSAEQIFLSGILEIKK